jgi:hypothetical protein
LKFLQEIIGETLQDIGLGFLNQTVIAYEILARIEKWNYIKLKAPAHKANDYQSEDTIHILGGNLDKLFIGQRFNIENI